MQRGTGWRARPRYSYVKFMHHMIMIMIDIMIDIMIEFESIVMTARRTRTLSTIDIASATRVRYRPLLAGAAADSTSDVD
jgi:hypothetical protein